METDINVFQYSVSILIYTILTLISLQSTSKSTQRTVFSAAIFYAKLFLHCEKKRLFYGVCICSWDTSNLLFINGKKGHKYQ